MGSSDLAAADARRRCAAAPARSARSAGSSAPTRRSRTSTAPPRARRSKKLTLDGVSYGTFVAERYALRYPTHVARLVLDSVVPHEGINGLSVENARAVGRVLRPSAANAAAREIRPSSSPSSSRDVEHRHGAARRAGDAERLRPDLPGRIGALLRRVATEPACATRQLLVDRFTPDPRTPAEALSQGLHASALCADNPMPWGGPATPIAQPAHRAARRRRESSRASIWPFTRAVASANGIVKHVPLLAARAGACRPARQAAPGADAAARRRPRPVDAARLGAAGARAGAEAASCRRPQGRPLGAAAGRRARYGRQALSAFLHAACARPTGSHRSSTAA